MKNESIIIFKKIIDDTIESYQFYTPETYYEFMAKISGAFLDTNDVASKEIFSTIQQLAGGNNTLTNMLGKTVAENSKINSGYSPNTTIPNISTAATISVPIIRFFLM